LENQLVIIGSIGYDIYVTGENNKIIFSPGGFAWHCASGMLAAGGTGWVLANITKSFNKDLLSRFHGSGIDIKINPSEDIFENAYVFDFSSPGYTQGVWFSEGKPSNRFSQLIEGNVADKVHVHVGTTNPETIVDRIIDIASNCSVPKSFSSNLYLPYLKDENYIFINEIISFSSILFVNYDELQELKRLNLFEQLMKKVVVVTCGKKGVYLFDNGFLVTSYIPSPQTEVSSIGAGDVLIGAFLSLIERGVSKDRALGLAGQIASVSVMAYGTSHIGLNTLSSIDHVNEISFSNLAVGKNHIGLLNLFCD
jgi:sugar/nucleoside kinase (ribokinase family)